MADIYLDSCDYATEVAPALAGSSVDDVVIIPAGVATWDMPLELKVGVELKS